MKTELSASAFAKKLNVTRSRIHQLIAQDRIRPRPIKRMVGESTWVYFIDPDAKVLASVVPPGRPRSKKSLDTTKGRA